MNLLVFELVRRLARQSREYLAGAEMVASGLTTQGSGVRGRRASLSSAEIMDGPASPTADC